MGMGVGETNSSVNNLLEKKKSNQVAPLDYKSSLECWADAKGIKQTWRGREKGPIKFLATIQETYHYHMI